MEAMPLRSRLLELAVVFLRLGAIGFGGPAAHIALMEGELVRKRRWLTPEAFLDLVGAVNLIPGPNSTEVAIHIGRLRAGFPGLVVAGVAFILPAFCTVLAIAWAYQRVGRLPETAALLHGIKPVVLVIIVHALVGLARTAVKNIRWAVAGAAAFAANLIWPLDEVFILLAIGAGAGLVAWRTSRDNRSVSLAAVPPLALAIAPLAQAGGAAAPIALSSLFLVFLKVGSLLFGSGYVLLAFLRADLVERLGWLTNAQLLDALAVGQVTPGPLFTTATFIGYTLAGLSGAVVATVAIFLPAFVFVAISGPIVSIVRRFPIAAAVLDGVNVGSLALMAAVTVTLARDALSDPMAFTIAAATAILLFRFRTDPTLLIAAGGLVGWVVEIGLPGSTLW